MMDAEFLAELRTEDEPGLRILDRIARQLVEADLLPQGRIEPLDFAVLLVGPLIDCGFDRLVTREPVAAPGAPDFAVRVRFDAAAYRRLAKAAENLARAFAAHVDGERGR